MQNLKLKQDEGGINQRLIERYGSVDMSRIEAAGRVVTVVLASPEIKRCFIRMFHITQINLHFILTMSRITLPHNTAEIDAIDNSVQRKVNVLLAEIDRRMVRAQVLMRDNCIGDLASYTAKPLEINVPVFSPAGRRYLDLMCKADHLVLMTDTLAMDEVIPMKTQIDDKASIKRDLRSFYSAVAQWHKELLRMSHDAARVRRDQVAAAPSAATRDNALPTVATAPAPRVRRKAAKERTGTGDRDAVTSATETAAGIAEDTLGASADAVEGDAGAIDGGELPGEASSAPAGGSEYASAAAPSAEPE